MSLVEPEVGQQQGVVEVIGNGSNAPMAPNSGLTEEQQRRVNAAIEYAQTLQQTVFKEVLEANKRRAEEENKLPLGTLAPGLEAGMEPRNHSVMSRIYVGSINFELTDEHIRKVFSEFGWVRSVSMSNDPTTGRHKGFGFVEYEVPEAATLAMEVMNGTMLGGRQLKIGRPNNYNVAVVQGVPPPPKERVYVANVNEAISEDSLKEIFAPFGDIERCVLAPDMVLRKHKGWGFIEFAQEEAAAQAALAMNGFSLGNLVLRVCKCVVGGPLGLGMAALDASPGGKAAESPFQPSVQLPQKVMAVAESINRSIGAAAQHTSNDETGQPGASTGYGGERDYAQESGTAGPQRPPASMDSSVVLLSNVVGEMSEVDDELAADMAEEGEKCGEIAKVVVHISTEEDISRGQEAVKIFIHYREEQSAHNAIELFDGRWFGGRKISARIYDYDQFRIETSTDTMVFIPGDE